MKRSQLLQLIILVIALILGYKSLEAVISILIPIIFQFSDRFSDSLSFVLRYLVFLVIYFGAFLLLVRYNKPIADYIDRQINAGAVADDEKIAFSIEQSNLLFIVLVAMALITLIEEIPVLLLSIYNYFKKEIGRLGSPDDLNFKITAIKFVVAMIVLFAAKPISAWFSKQLSSDKPLIETISEPDNSNNPGV